MSIVQAKLLYANEAFVGGCNITTGVNGALLIGGFREAYVTPGKAWMNPLVVFDQPKAGTTYIKGIWVNEAGYYKLIDGTLADFTAKINGCCGTDAVITPVYNGVFPDLEAETPLRTVTIQRVDRGNDYDNAQAIYKYTKAIGASNFSRTGYANGKSTYTFQTRVNPVAPVLGADGTTLDIVTMGTIVYTSNTPGALAGGQHYNVQVNVNGNPIGVPTPYVGAADATLATVATALNANATYTAWGTYASPGGTVITLTSSNADNVTIVITKA